MLPEISHTEKDKYPMSSLICGISKKKKNTEQIQIGDFQSQGYGMGKMGERDQQVQISSYKINHDDIMYSMMTIVDNAVLNI